MAIVYENKVPDYKPSDAEFPDGSIKTGDATENGTALVSELFNDIVQTFDKLVRDAGITKNNKFDGETNGYQLLSALVAKINEEIQPTAQQVSTNTGNISGNTTAIGNNTSAISSNTTAIGNNTSAIASLAPVLTEAELVTIFPHSSSITDISISSTELRTKKVGSVRYTQGRFKILINKNIADEFLIQSNVANVFTNQQYGTGGGVFNFVPGFVFAEGSFYTADISIRSASAENDIYFVQKSGGFVTGDTISVSFSGVVIDNP